MTKVKGPELGNCIFMAKKRLYSEMKKLSGSFFSLREFSFSSIWTAEPGYAWLDSHLSLENESSLSEMKVCL